MARHKHKDHKASTPQRSPGAPPPAALQPLSAPSLGVIELTEQNFAASVDGHPFAVIGIWAPSSALSRAFASSFEAAAARHPDALFAKVDADAERAVVEQFEITSLPTLIIFRSNIIVHAKAGMLQAQELDQVVNTARALDMQQVRRKVVSVNPVAIGDPGAPTTDVHAIQPADSRGVVELTDRNFAAYVSGHPFAVVNFWAPSSAPSQAFASAFAGAATSNPELLFVKVNAEEQPATVAQFKISSTPALLIIRDNIVVHANAGTLDARALHQALGAARALDMQQVRRKVGMDAVAPRGPVVPATNIDARSAAEASQLSIETYLRASLRGSASALQDAGRRLAAGALVTIRDAFEPDFAERMYRSLDSCNTWRAHENYAERFSYYHHNVYHPEDFPPDVAWCWKVFDSSGSKAWATRLSGRTCLGPTSMSASWYLPGDHSLPHTDNVTTGDHYIRQLAFVWHLAKEWRSEWGGAFYWCPKACYMPPAFNTLYLFNVSSESSHFVTQVSPYAVGKRLTLNGWWTGPAATPGPVWKGPDRIGTDQTEILIY